MQTGAATATSVIGAGSPWGDDAVGWVVARGLAERRLPGVRVAQLASPIDLLDHLLGAEQLIICDAFCGDGPVGSVRRWDWPDETIVSQRYVGSHDLSLAAVLQLADQLGELPGRISIWGIDIGRSPQLAPGQRNAAAAMALSEELERAIAGIVARLCQVLGHA